MVVTGLALVVLAIVRAFHWAALAAVGGALAALGAVLGPALRGLGGAAEAAADLPDDFPHLLDLLRRAYGAPGAWIVGAREGDITAEGPEVDAAARARGLELAQRAAVESRAEIFREGAGTYVTAGAFPYGAAVLIGEWVVAASVRNAVAADLARVMASLGHVEVQWARADRRARELAALSSPGQPLEVVAGSAARLVAQVSHQPAVVAIQDGPGGVVRVAGRSPDADERLVDAALPRESAVARAIQTMIPVVALPGEDVFGLARAERRQDGGEGTVYPLVDQGHAVGALVVLGTRIEAGSLLAEQITRLAGELGPRLATARAVREAQERAQRDALTGLYNLRVLEVRLGAAAKPAPRGSLIYVDLDHFKQLNDTLGHPAGDAALQFVAQVLQRETRDRDLATRIGGEEFAVWLPGAPLERGAAVAERIRRAVEEGRWGWNGRAYPLTASCGVAAVPETTEKIADLRACADAALYQAKTGGRNRVELARPSR